VFTKVDNNVCFRKFPAITNDEVATLMTDIASRILKHLKRAGLLDQEGEIKANPALAPFFEENESLRFASQCSIAGKIAFGPAAGQYVTKIGGGLGYLEEVPLAQGKRFYSVNGFSCHAPQ
jgi:hypothetical protein